MHPIFTLYYQKVDPDPLLNIFSLMYLAKPVDCVPT